MHWQSVSFIVQKHTWNLSTPYEHKKTSTSVLKRNNYFKIKQTYKAILMCTFENKLFNQFISSFGTIFITTKVLNKGLWLFNLLFIYLIKYVYNGLKGIINNNFIQTHIAMNINISNECLILDIVGSISTLWNCILKPL